MWIKLVDCLFLQQKQEEFHVLKMHEKIEVMVHDYFLCNISIECTVPFVTLTQAGCQVQMARFHISKYILTFFG